MILSCKANKMIIQEFELLLYTKTAVPCDFIKIAQMGKKPMIVNSHDMTCDTEYTL